jgi:uncharacterized membrane protein
MKDTDIAPAFPKEWPGAFAIYKLSRDCVRKNLDALIPLAIILFALNFTFGLIRTSLTNHLAAAVFQLVSSLLSVFFAVIIIRAYLLTARHKPIEFEALFNISSLLFWRMLLLNLLTTISVIGGLILLIVPGILIGMRLSMAPYYLVDQNLSVLDAYKASWHATRGNLGKLWGLFGLGVLILLPIFTIIGIVVTIYLFFMFSAASALLYLYLLKHPEKTA